LFQASELVSPGWKLGLTTSYNFLDQVLDVSVTETNEATAKTQLHTIAARPFIEHDLTSKSGVRLEIIGERDYHGFSVR